MQARRLLVIQGEEQAGLRKADSLLGDFPAQYVISNDEPLKRFLGREFSAVIYNAYRGLDPDELAAMTGTLIAGGVLLLILPELKHWPKFNDPFKDRIASWPCRGTDLSNYFIERFVHCLNKAEFVEMHLASDKNLHPLKPVFPLHHDKGFMTSDQRHALQALIEYLDSDNPVPVVLQADRGRGKSAVLGMLAAWWVKSGKGLVIVTAPAKKTTEVIFRHAGQQGSLKFYPPDFICQQQPPAELLLIDEAAALPASLLDGLLRHYPAIVFATTVHGYEGTGRGFAVRFQQHLDRQAPGWKKRCLQQPVRYGENDPLELFLADALLLNAQPPSIQSPGEFDLEKSQFSQLHARELIVNETQLREVFGLLILAHYQTRPRDLRHMLDGVNVRIYVICFENHVIATALTVLEGGFDATLAKKILYGVRRLRGHLIPQSLANHAGLIDAPLLKTERIMRIVVHPQLQHLGIARLLLARIKQSSKSDYLSSSFGANAGLITFWNKQGYEVVRMGLKRDKSSGFHSAIVMLPVTASGRQLFNKARLQFSRYYPVLRKFSLRDLDYELANLIGAGVIKEQQDLSEALDRMDLQSFAQGFRGYENCLLVIWKTIDKVKKKEQLWSALSPCDQLLLESLDDGMSMEKLKKSDCFHGKKMIDKKLRSIIQQLVVKLA